MNCGAFEVWLDHGMTAALLAEAEAHAASCAACRLAWGAARAITVLLEDSRDSVPRDFSLRVMERIAAGANRLDARSFSAMDAGLPPWIRALTAPETVLAIVLGALLVAKGPEVARRTVDLMTPSVMPAMQQAAVFGRALSLQPALAVITVAGFFLCCYGLYRLTLAMVSSRTTWGETAMSDRERP